MCGRSACCGINAGGGEGNTGEERGMDGKDIIPLIEPIFRFCYHRLNDRYDAEDLASEILCHILDGMGKYQIESLEAWAWRIAHNRYAHFLEERNRRREYISEEVLFELADDYSQVDKMLVEDEYEPVFRCLHTLSAGYRNIFVDYYMAELSIRQLAQKYSLSETTVKWRLNVGRGKIRERMGESGMEKVYQRINWNCNGCNGGMDSGKYLHSQIARAICKAAYEKPLTVEEISLCTGIPALYIEDELPRLEYGDAVRKNGDKYGTEFIIFRMEDRAKVEAVTASMVKQIAAYYEKVLCGKSDAVRALGFYGCNFSMKRLGYLLVPYLMRRKIKDLKENRLHMPNGKYPPRKDGGFGWFLVEETEDEKEASREYATGCNVSGGDSGSSAPGGCGRIYYYWINKHFVKNLYHNGGTRWLCVKGIPQRCKEGVVSEKMLEEEDRLRLLRINLLVKEGEAYKLNFPCFTRQQFMDFTALFAGEDEVLDKELSRWLLSARRSFEKFVPKRLHAQINQWIACYAGEIIGLVMEELVQRGVLEPPETEQTEPDVGKPLVNGIFYVEGDMVDV